MAQQKVDPTRQWTPRPEGGPDEQARKIVHISNEDNAPTRVYAETAEDRAKRDMEKSTDATMEEYVVRRKKQRRIVTQEEQAPSEPSGSEIKVELISVDRAESEREARKMFGVEEDKEEDKKE